MTDMTLHDLLASWEREHQQGRDATRVTPSATSTLCLRQAAFRINEVPQSDSPDPVTVATVGSLIHLGVAVLWDEAPNVLGTEWPLRAGGQIDAFRGTTGHREVRDLKTVSRAKFDAWENNEGPPEEVWQQLAEYGARARAELGHDDDYEYSLIVDALCREDGRTATYERTWEPELAEAAQRSLARVEAVRGVDPLDVPASRSGRGDWFCDSCPWLTACMGPDDRTPLATELAPEVAAQLARDYLHWKRIARDAEDRAQQARRELMGTAGRAGEYQITWAEVASSFRPPTEGSWSKPYSTLKVTKVKP